MKRALVEANGFTLIEAIVALVILGIAATGIIRAAEAHVDNTRGLEQRDAAQWVADNALAEAQLGLIPAREQAMLNSRWKVGTSARQTDDPDIRQLQIEVEPAAGGGPRVTLRGFVDVGNRGR